MGRRKKKSSKLPSSDTNNNDNYESAKPRRGRKPADPPEVVEKALLENKVDIIENGKVVSKKNEVWERIRKEHNLKTNALGLHTFVVCNRGDNIHHKLGLKVSAAVSSASEDDPDCMESEGSVEPGDQEIETSNEKITMSRKIYIPKEKWHVMKPSEVTYQLNDPSRPGRMRTYLSLAPGVWCNVLNNVIHSETRLPCSWTFKPHYIALTSDAEFYLKVHGECKCGGTLLATSPNPPPDDPEKSGLWLSVSIDNARNDSHSDVRKRPIRGEARLELGNRMVNEGLSACLVRKEVAGQNCELFETEPGIVPRLESLRQIKSQTLSRQKLAPGEVESIRLLKYSEPFKQSISDIGDDPFFVHYLVPEQLRVYNAYAEMGYCRIILDSSGKVVLKIIRPDGLSGHIFIYIIVVSLPGEHEGQIPVYQMLSERHNTNAICFWLMEWLRLGARVPQEIVIDFSPALLLSLCKVFAHAKDRDEYIDKCFRYLRDPASNPRPAVLIRIDIAHLINLISKWKCVKEMRRRCKEFFIRSIYIIVLARTFEMAERVIRAIFIVASNETEGNSVTTEQATPCEYYKSYLLDLIGAAKEDIDAVEARLADQCREQDDPDEPDSSPPVQETPPQLEGPLHDWLDGLYIECTGPEYVVQDGDRDNLMFSPDFRKAFLDLCYKLPLWSNIMARAMQSPYEKAIGAHVESTFNDLFTRLITRQYRADIFLQKHLTILRNSMILASTLEFFRKKNQCLYCTIGAPKDCQCTICCKGVHDAPSCSTLEGDSRRICSGCRVQQLSGLADGDHLDGESESPIVITNGSENVRHSKSNTLQQDLPPGGDTVVNPKENSNCFACSIGSMPDPEGSHHCITCKKQVHALPGCSEPAPGTEEGYGQGRVCVACVSKKNSVLPNLGINPVAGELKTGSPIFNTKPKGLGLKAMVNNWKGKNKIDLPHGVEKAQHPGHPEAKSNCPACSLGNMPDPEGSHHCIICKKPVHALPGCSEPAPGTDEGYGQARVCVTCSSNTCPSRDLGSSIKERFRNLQFPQKNDAVPRKTFSAELVPTSEEVNAHSSQATAEPSGLNSLHTPGINSATGHIEKGSPIFNTKPRGIGLKAVANNGKEKNKIDLPHGVWKAKHPGHPAAKSNCPACSLGNMPDPEGSHHCITCKKPVHALPGCSEPAPGTDEGYGQARVCVACVLKKNTVLPILGGQKTRSQMVSDEPCSPTFVHTAGGGEAASPVFNTNPRATAKVTSLSKHVDSVSLSSSLKENERSEGHKATSTSPILSGNAAGFRRKRPQPNADASSTLAGSTCVLCKTKVPCDLTCIRCNKIIHEVEGCSKLMPGSDGIHKNDRICQLCLKLFPSPAALDMWHYENWRGKGQNPVKRGAGYYARPNPELALRIDNKFDSQLKPMQNGGTVGARARKLGGVSVSLSNTCAVDALIHLCATAYCDSPSFREVADASNSPLLKIAVKICREGVKAEAYQMRAEMLYNCLPDARKLIAFNLHQLNCARAPDELLHRLHLPPSLVDNMTCSSQFCPKRRDQREIPIVGAHPGFLVEHGIQRLEDAIKENTLVGQFSPCLKPFSEEELTAVPLIPGVVENYPQDLAWSKHAMCGGTITHVPDVQKCVFVSVVGEMQNPLHPTDLGTTERYLQCTLEQIPATIFVGESFRVLRGVVAARPPAIQDKKFATVSLSHFITYSRRIGGKWDVFDDLKKKQVYAAQNTALHAVLLLYSVID